MTNFLVLIFWISIVIMIMLYVDGIVRSLLSAGIEDPRKSTAAIIIIALKQLNKCHDDACIAIIVKSARLSPTLREVL